MKELAGASSSHVACTNSPYEVNADDVKKTNKKKLARAACFLLVNEGACLDICKCSNLQCQPVSLYLNNRSYIHVHFACILGYKLMCECDYISVNKNSTVYVFIPVF